MRPTICVYHPQLADEYADVLQAAGIGPVYKAKNPQEAETVLPECDVLFGWKIPMHLLAAATKLRWIQSMGAGVDDLFQSRDIASDITVTRIVGQFGQPIAEHVFAHLLYEAKNMKTSFEAQNRSVWAPFIGRTLAGKTIGIAGLGSIGCKVAEMAQAFNMRILGLSRTRAACPAVEEHYTPAAWQDFAEQLDYLVLALPLTPDTHQVVNKAVLSVMKEDAWVVNVGRGDLIEETALLEALLNHQIGGAILDVFSLEPLPASHAFWKLPNVHVTPHLSGPSQVDEVAQFFVQNFRRYEAGGELVGVVDAARGY